MNIVDANVLLYAVNKADLKHARSRAWLDGALNEGHTVAFAWIVLLTFLRLSTKVGLFPRPLPVAEAIERVRAWTGHPASIIVEPTARHLEILAGLLQLSGTGANLVTDGHLAALAVEHDSTIVTFDSDFGRFPGVRWSPPPA